MTVAKGTVVWLTGLPASGKSTLALRLARHLRARHPVILDSDAVRAAIASELGYGPASRARFYAQLARLAALLASQGHLVLVAATAHRRAFRALARRLAPRFVEVFVEANAADCSARDVKGLYRRAPAALPGAGTAYEPPAHPDVIVHGGRDPEAVRRVVAALRARPRRSR